MTDESGQRGYQPAGYTAIGLGLSYFSVQEMIDTALREASPKHRAAFAMGSQASIDSLLESIRASILLAALHDGLRIDRENVNVSANQAGLSATVHWSVPIVSLTSPVIDISGSLGVSPRCSRKSI